MTSETATAPSAPSSSAPRRSSPPTSFDRGIVLTGGTSLLRNLDRLITQEIGISCYVADNPLECVAMGAGIALDHLDLIKRSMPAEGEWLVSFSTAPPDNSRTNTGFQVFTSC
jgi:hypothetical protein